MFFRASCQFRPTPDYKSRALANWLKGGRVGKLAISRRYNQLPLLHSSLEDSRLAVWDLPIYVCIRIHHRCFSIAGAKYTYFLNLQYFATKNAQKLKIRFLQVL